jgi:hypothetical protein
VSAVFVHVVLATFRPGTPQEVRAEIQRKQAELGEACGGKAAGILHWTSGWNLDQRKSWHLMEFAVFADEAAFRRFHAHPAHQAFGLEMRDVADWAVGDIEADLPFGLGT